MNEEAEALILKFEETWRREGACDIKNCLDRLRSPTSNDRRELLVELICVELEFLWKGRGGSGQSFLEDYATRHPELGAPDEFPIEIIEQEYRVRCQWGDRPSHDAFLSRFRGRQERIQAALTRVDSNLRDESRESCVREIRDPSGKTSTWKFDGDVGVTRISHRDILLRRMIGSGKAGKVYEAWQRSEDRTVAVKFLRKAYIHRPEIVNRFIKEAAILGGLRHPNLVELHGFGSTPGGSCFIVQELVDGPNLDFLIKTQVVSVVDATRWTVDICDGIEAAHSNGIIHCDLKPANILIDRAGCVRVSDFGLARSFVDLASSTDEIEGTAPFMAPEQASRYWGAIDERTDVYGVGAVLFTLLTGRPPWIGRRLPDVLAEIIGPTPVIAPNVLRPDLSDTLTGLCRKCLSKSPGDRYQSIAELREALIGSIGD